MANWNTDVGISGRYGDPQKTKPNTRVVQLGDGYEQRSFTGLNHMLTEFNYVFDKVTDTEKETIIDFFEARNGTEAFVFTPEGGAAITVVCEEWSAVPVNYNMWDISVKFRQVAN